MAKKVKLLQTVSVPVNMTVASVPVNMTMASVPVNMIMTSPPVTIKAYLSMVPFFSIGTCYIPKELERCADFEAVIRISMQAILKEL